MRGATWAIVLALLAAASGAAASAPVGWLLVETDPVGDAEVRVWIEGEGVRDVGVRWTGGWAGLDRMTATPSGFEGKVPGAILGPSARLVLQTDEGSFESGLLGVRAGEYTRVAFLERANVERLAVPEEPIPGEAGESGAGMPPSILLAGGALVAAAYMVAVAAAERPSRREAGGGSSGRRKALRRPALGPESGDLARYLDATWPSAAVGRAAADGVAAKHPGDVLDAMSARGGIVAEIVAIRPSALILRVAGGCAYACGFLARAFESLADGPVVVEETRCHATRAGVPRDRPAPVVAGLHRRRWRPCEIVVHVRWRSPRS